MDNNVVCKICKVYPAKNKKITGILPDQKVITEPGIYHLNLKEIRRCMNFADVFEVVKNGDVLLHEGNYTADNSKATVTPADQVPEMTDTTIHYGVHDPSGNDESNDESASSSNQNDSNLGESEAAAASTYSTKSTKSNTTTQSSTTASTTKNTTTSTTTSDTTSTTSK